MRNKIITLTLGAALLCSCGIPLREDLENFVSTFSIEKCFEDYKESKYVSTWIIESGTDKEKEVDEFYFNVKDINNKYYELKGSTYKNDVLNKSKYEKCFKDGDKYYFEKDSEKVDSSETDCNAYISKFFYTEIVQGAYHSGGMYYGDFILDNIRKAQAFYTVNGDSLNYAYEEEQNGVLNKISFSVNKLGMLEKYSYSGTNGTAKITQEITVENVK